MDRTVYRFIGPRSYFGVPIHEYACTEG